MAISPLPPVPLRSDTPANFINKADAFLAALSTFRSEANAVAEAMNLGAVTANSTTSLTIATGTQSLTVDVAKSYVPGMTVKIASSADATKWMLGDVTAYNSLTGALVVVVTAVQNPGGPFSAWTISQSAPGGAALHGSSIQDFSARDLDVRNLYQSLGADIASASTIDLDSASGDTINVTGTTTINAITLSAGRVKRVRHTGSQTLTHSASLLLPASANILTQTGDYSVWIGYPSGVVRCLAYHRATAADDIGMIKAFAGTSVPAGYLACPTTQTDVLRADFPGLFAAIGTAWNGGGTPGTSFGLPYFPADYTMVQGGTVGTNTDGAVISHSHVASYQTYTGGSGYPGYDGVGDTFVPGSTSATGGTANLAAGKRVKFCVKY